MNEQPNEPGFTLWHRHSKYFRWREIASALTEAELTRHLLALPSGETMTLPRDEHPNDNRGTIKR